MKSEVKILLFDRRIAKAKKKGDIKEVRRLQEERSKIVNKLGTPAHEKRVRQSSLNWILILAIALGAFAFFSKFLSGKGIDNLTMLIILFLIFMLGINMRHKKRT